MGCVLQTRITLGIRILFTLPHTEAQAELRLQEGAGAPSVSAPTCAEPPLALSGNRCALLVDSIVPERVWKCNGKRTGVDDSVNCWNSGLDLADQELRPIHDVSGRNSSESFLRGSLLTRTRTLREQV